jgi:serralysin
MAATSKSVSNSGDGDIDALLWGSKWSTGNLFFSFPTSATVYSYDGEPDQGFQQFTPELKDVAREVFGVFSQYARLSFTETTSNTADLRIAMTNLATDDTPALARGYFPSDGAKNGDLWLDTQSNWTPVKGNSDYWALLHEIGHTLGLSHPGFSMDPTHVGHDYTIMSIQAFPTHEAPFSYIDVPQTPMLADVAALQYMYGANYDTRPLDTVYSWSPTTGETFIDGIGQGRPVRNIIYMTLWDGGGIDTYDFASYTKPISIDLRPGEWTNPGLTNASAGAGPFQVATLGLDPDGFVHARGSIANAYLFNGDTRSLIENANGGADDDDIIGNQANNTLRGNGGDDTLFYTAGNDALFGDARGDNGDTADFSMSSTAVIINPVAAFQTITISGRTLTIPITPGSLKGDTIGNKYNVTTTVGATIASLTGIENLTGSRFGDTITGDTGDNTIKAGDGNDLVFYTGGFDDLNGGGGTDTINFSKFGSAVSVSILANKSGTEAFTSDSASIPLFGTLRAIAELGSFENVVGTAFADVITGSNGANTINGGAGADRMSGNNGNDRYFVDNTGDRAIETSAAGGIDSVFSSVSFTLGAFVENLTLTGLSSISGAGNELANELIGNVSANTLSGNDGADILEGRGGNDTLIGGFGNDAYVFSGGSLANDTFIDSGGIDTVLVDSLSDVISANRVGNDLLVFMDGGSFRVQNHFAGGNIETIQDDSRSVVLATGTVGGDAGGIIGGTGQDDIFDGRGGDDLLFGGHGRDILLGGTGDDRIDGGFGRDILDGGAGNDMLTGGPGRDTFVFRPASADGGPGHDVILDFSNGDLIDLRAFHTSFRAFDDDRDRRLEDGEGDGRIEICIDHGDAVLTFDQSSIRIENYTRLDSGDFLF